SATGVTECVVGSGGHGIQQFIATDSRMVRGFDGPNTFGALRLELNPQGAAYQFINTQNSTLDNGSIPCDSTVTDLTDPTPPTNLVASSDSANTVALSWTAATDNVGVTAYNVYRNGALLTTIAPATSYTDTTAAA